MPSFVLPAYEAPASPSSNLTEKPKPPTTQEPCSIHGQSETPHIDSQLCQPRVREYLLTLSEALANAADDNACTKCATDTVGRTMTACMQDMKAAKKSGNWSKDDKKAIKKESKILMKGMKRDLKAMWREEKK